MIQPTLEIDSRNADGYIAELARRIDVPMEVAVRAESKSILQETLNRTKVRSTKTVKSKVARVYNTFSEKGPGRKTPGRPKVSRTRGKVWMIRENKEGELTFLHMDGTRRWSDRIWNQYQKLVGMRDTKEKQRTKEMLSRRGLKKQSWFLLGETIGAKLRAAGYIVKAAMNGRALTEVAKALVDKFPGRFSIRFQNFSKLARYWKDEDKLLSVLRGRVKFFDTNLRKGVFDTAEAIAKKYPGISVR